MSADKPYRGLIGMSWAAYYLAKGFAVRATDSVAIAIYMSSPFLRIKEKPVAMSKFVSSRKVRKAICKH